MLLSNKQSDLEMDLLDQSYHEKPAEPAEILQMFSII